MAANPKVENDSQTESISDCDSCLVLKLINTFKIPQCGQKKKIVNTIAERFSIKNNGNEG